MSLRRLLSRMMRCCITYDAPWNLRSSERCCSHSLLRLTTCCCCSSSLCCSSAFSCTIISSVLPSLFEMYSCSNSTESLSCCSWSASCFFCSSIEATLSFSSSSMRSRVFFSLDVSDTCFWSLLEMYSCSCSSLFSRSTFSMSTLRSLFWRVLVRNSSSCSTCCARHSFSCLSLSRWLELSWSLASMTLLSLFCLPSSSSTFFCHALLSFSISSIRAMSLLVMSSSSASIWLCCTPICRLSARFASSRDAFLRFSTSSCCLRLWIMAACSAESMAATSPPLSRACNRCTPPPTRIRAQPTPP
mmetsp:Transcript_50407/g.122933  ORF Transcript_50407/g.122933 Transcript_50407/m.122933 type:complete len:302 (+) Transcript_50407:569-1474(+)